MTTLHEREPPELTAAASRVPLGHALLLLQCLLLLLVVRFAHVEERRGLFELLCLSTAGLLVHRMLPVRWRPVLFLVVSLLSFPLAFVVQQVPATGWFAAIGIGLTQSAWVVGPGVGLIAVCHLPLPWMARAALLVAAAGGVIWARAESIEPFWAVFGSIFMFRLWIYLRELRRAGDSAPWSIRLSYFFVLSNGFFPFFPILNFRTFASTYSSEDTGAIAQRGIAWILRGLIHLLCYRAIKMFVLPAPIDLIDLPSIGLFLAVNYALYLQVSGHFHIITGLMHLFGFDLPRTHDRYFLASSFSDIWRRINIYWKDFINEFVFLPVFFLLNRLPRQVAVVVAVGAAFAATWILHSWQAFWLLGNFPLGANDAALWFAAGMFVAVNSLLQYRAVVKRARSESRSLTMLRAARHTLQIMGTFFVVSFFWACWTVPGFPRLIAASVRHYGVSSSDVAVGLAVFGGIFLTGMFVQLIVARLEERGTTFSFPLERSPALCVAALGLLALIASPAVTASVDSRAARVVSLMTSETPTMAELGLEVEGYYEELVVANLQAASLTQAGTPRSPHAVMWSEVSRQRNDIVESEMIPGWSGTLAGVPFHVNRWGMRDDDVSSRKPPDEVRIAVVGSSATMGYGVRQDEDFESLIERRLNEDASPNGKRISLLNFATGGYVALQWAAVLPEKVFPLQPDTLLYVAHQGDMLGPSRHLTMCLEMDYPRPYACLDKIAREAGAVGEMPWGARGLLLEARSQDILRCLYRGIVEDCRKRGIVPVYVYLPMPGIDQIPARMDDLLLQIAREAGFVVIDLSDWADGRSEKKLMMDGHHHPTATAHRLIAEQMLTALRQEKGLLPDQ